MGWTTAAAERSHHVTTLSFPSMPTGRRDPHREQAEDHHNEDEEVVEVVEVVEERAAAGASASRQQFDHL